MYLNNWSRCLIIIMIGIAILMIALLGLHLFGPTILHIGLYSQLFGALLGGLLAIISVNIPIRLGEEAEPWLGRERLAWTLVGAGAILWGLGECAYRYELANNLPNFPALSDWGYATLPPLVFLGLLLQPDSDTGRGRWLVLLDSLISMGAILAIAWFLLLGSMAQAPNEDNLARFLGLYYPITDMALLSCVIFLILRGRGRTYASTARRIGLLLVGIGICVFAVSDFNYNVQNNMSTYVDGTWADLGWPLGLMTIGVAAYLRRFILTTPGNLIEERRHHHEASASFGLAQLIPYLLLGTLLLVLVVNILSRDATQIWNRPVLLFATVGVVSLVVVRQLITQLDNERLAHRQTVALERLATANARVEEQARSIADHNASLEEGIAHLKAVQAQIANGNMRVRARISGGDLVSLAGSLNLMADRLVRFDQVETYAHKLTRALNELSYTFELYRSSGRFILSPGSNEFPEISHLLISMGMKQALPNGASTPFAGGTQQQPGTRSQSKPLASSSSPRPPSAQLTQRANPPGTPRVPSSQLSSPDLREKSAPLTTPEQRTEQNSSRPLRGFTFPGEPGFTDPSRQDQLEFPPFSSQSGLK
ncbi:MAG TPA: hypothetical protein VGD98_05535 [Ktedonobacteraceae bacterium]